MKLNVEQLAQVTQLVRAGQLQAATSALQAALGGHAPQGTGPTVNPTAPAAYGDVIDVPSRVVPQTTDDGIPAPAAAPDAADAVQAQPAAQAAANGEAPGAGARFIAGEFSHRRDARGYKLFVPKGAHQRPLPLVVMLHGCTQDPDDFAAGTAMNELADACGFYVLYPHQSRKANPQGCWNWFKHSHQQRDRGEPALLAEMTRQVMADHAIDAQRVYVAGLSAGGAMAAILGDAYPDLYAAVGVHSGLAAGSALDLPSALSAMKGAPPRSAAGGAASGIPTIVFHGDADATVHPSNGEHVISACVAATATVETSAVEGAGVRRATRAIYRDASGQIIAERWTVHGAPHAWSGGRAQGSYTDGRGPDASAEMLRFFLAHPMSPGGAPASSAEARRA